MLPVGQWKRAKRLLKGPVRAGQVRFLSDEFKRYVEVAEAGKDSSEIDGCGLVRRWRDYDGKPLLFASGNEFPGFAANFRSTDKGLQG